MGLFGIEYDQERDKDLHIEGFGRRRNEEWAFRSGVFNRIRKNREMSFLLEIGLFNTLEAWENLNGPQTFPNPLFSFGQKIQINKNHQNGLKVLKLLSALHIIDKDKVRRDLQSMKSSETKDFFLKIQAYK